MPFYFLILKTAKKMLKKTNVYYCQNFSTSMYPIARKSEREINKQLFFVNYNLKPMRQFYVNACSFFNFPIRLFFACLFFNLVCPSVNYAQRAYRQFSTQAVDKQFHSVDTGVIERKQAIEKYVKNYQHIGDLPNYTIPVIFHHVYQTRPISFSTVEEQLNALNTAFQYEHDWQHPAHTILDIEDLTPQSEGIQFCFADVDLMGNGLKGYSQMRVSVNEWSIDSLVSRASSRNNTSGFDFTAYQPENYLNIWIVDLPGQEAGYAQMPWSPQKADGIVINRKVFEPLSAEFEPYNQGKTLVHLVGSYLGLYELWNDDKPCVDDRVFDTPLHNAPNYGTYSEYRHISLCNGNPVELTMNFMDATDDNYMYFFTKGQMLRIVAMLSEGGPRGGLKDAQNLCNQVAPIQSRINLNSTNTTIPNFQIYPNPTKDHITINYSSDSNWQSFQLFSPTGQLLQSLPSIESRSELKIDCTKYPSGIYFITASNQFTKQTQRFTLNK